MNDSVSEAAEMYLLRIALLSHDSDVVPITRLAETLDVSPISANQMCRKLEARGLVVYQPYKGVMLTSQGEAIALRVLRKRRLWEVFLSEKLGVAPEMAEEIACRFEHVTPGELAEKLADFLGNPSLSPQDQPIPSRSGEIRAHIAHPLSSLDVGERVRITGIAVDETQRSFLRLHHIVTGVEVTLQAATDKAILIEANGQTIALASSVAQHIDTMPLDAAAIEVNTSNAR